MARTNLNPVCCFVSQSLSISTRPHHRTEPQRHGGCFSHAQSFDRFSNNDVPPCPANIRPTLYLVRCPTPGGPHRETSLGQGVQDLSLGQSCIASAQCCTAYIGSCPTQNPDEPDTKPKLQSYVIDLNQTGPMVSLTAGHFTPRSFLKMVRFWMHSSRSRMKSIPL